MSRRYLFIRCGRISDRTCSLLPYSTNLEQSKTVKEEITYKERKKKDHHVHRYENFLDRSESVRVKEIYPPAEGGYAECTTYCRYICRTLEESSRVYSSTKQISAITCRAPDINGKINT
jgi:hypothetical protein